VGKFETLVGHMVSRNHCKSNTQHTLWAIRGYQERTLRVLYKSWEH